VAAAIVVRRFGQLLGHSLQMAELDLRYRYCLTEVQRRITPSKWLRQESSAARKAWPF
jgi:hypothetical protein